jgi:hypothetical protein
VFESYVCFHSGLLNLMPNALVIPVRCNRAPILHPNPIHPNPKPQIRSTFLNPSCTVLLPLPQRHLICVPCSQPLHLRATPHHPLHLHLLLLHPP